jgi:8-oxo-dGTP diphosphatase
MSANAPIGVAVALLLRDGCVLMGERKSEKIYPLHWEFPGGKIESGETAVDALRRELHEELAIEIVDAELYFSEVATYSNGITYSISYFLVRTWDGEITDLEFNRAKWISAKMLPNLLHLSGNKAILAKLMHEEIPR